MNSHVSNTHCYAHFTYQNRFNMYMIRVLRRKGYGGRRNIEDYDSATGEFQITNY